MSKLSRRSLLGGLLAGGAMAGASSLWPRGAGATTPPPNTSPAFGSYKILEIFLDGGADLWMHGYQTPWGPYATWIDNIGGTPGGAGTEGLHHIPQGTWNAMFQGVPPNPSWVPTWPQPLPNPTLLTHAFGTDRNGQPVTWGPAFMPLWMATPPAQSPARPLPDITRMVMVGHRLDPHELAVPLALTGTGLGRAIACSLGAPVNRIRPPNTPPVSFVIPADPVNTSGATMAAAAATGFHGAENTPVIIPVGAAGSTTTYDRLDRSQATNSLVSRAAGDPLRSHYDKEYRALLTHGGRVRSGAYDAYEGALLTLEEFAGVRARIGGINFVEGNNGLYDNRVATAIKAGFSLLSPGAGARHVTVVDVGWDHHASQFATATAYARRNTLRIFPIAHAIAEAYASGLFDPLTTMVYIHSEFGRYHEGLTGTQHGFHAYPVILMGGPINTGSAPSNPLVGATGSLLGNPADRDAQNSPELDDALDLFGVEQTYGVADVRAAVALAAGVDPWHPDMYVESDTWIGHQIAAAGGATAASLTALQADILGA